jgi:hypothetical protein
VHVCEPRGPFQTIPSPLPPRLRPARRPPVPRPFPDSSVCICGRNRIDRVGCDPVVDLPDDQSLKKCTVPAAPAAHGSTGRARRRVVPVTARPFTTAALVGASSSLQACRRVQIWSGAAVVAVPNRGLMSPNYATRYNAKRSGWVRVSPAVTLAVTPIRLKRLAESGFTRSVPSKGSASACGETREFPRDFDAEGWPSGRWRWS